MQWRWSVVPVRAGVEYANISYHLNTIVNPASGGTRVLRVPNAFLRATTYAVTLSLTNFLGISSTSAPAYITMAGGRGLPSLELTPTSLATRRSQVVSIFAKAAVSR
jgi:hypothetical protein